MKRVRIQKSYARLGYDIWFFHYMGRSYEAHMVEPIELKFKKIPEGSIFPEPSLFIREEDMLPFVKALMEGLEESGLSDKIREDQGVLKATREHLDDMRKMSDRMLLALTRTTDRTL